MPKNEPNFDEASKALHAWADEKVDHASDKPTKEMVKVMSGFSAQAAMVALRAAFSNQKDEADR